MNDDTVRFRFRHGLLGAAIVLVVLVAFFPYHYLEPSLQSFINQNLPGSFHISDLDIQGPLRSSTDVSVTINERIVSLPLVFQVVPAWTTVTIDIRTEFEGFSGSIDPLKRKAKGQLNAFPLSEVFLNVEGKGNGNFTLKQTDGGFKMSFVLDAQTTEPIRPSPLIPPMLNGQMVKEFHCKGKIVNNVISSNDFRLKTDQAHLDAHGSMRIRRPMKNSHMNATLNLKWPNEQTIKLNDTLAGIGLL